MRSTARLPGALRRGLFVFFVGALGCAAEEAHDAEESGGVAGSAVDEPTAGGAGGSGGSQVVPANSGGSTRVGARETRAGR